MPYRIIALIICGLACVITAALLLNRQEESPAQRERIL